MSCNFNNQQIVKDASINVRHEIDVPLDALLERSLPEMELNNFKRINDTIIFTSPASFLYFPMGKFKKETEILNNYPELKLSNQQYVSDAGLFQLYKYRYKQSFIKMIKNDESGLLDIVSAKIVDKDITLKNGVAVGIQKTNFIKLFFKPGVNLENYNVVKIESLILGITHIYSFNEGRLNEIIIDSDYQVDKK